MVVHVHSRAGVDVAVAAEHGHHGLTICVVRQDPELELRVVCNDELLTGHRAKSRADRVLVLVQRRLLLEIRTPRRQTAGGRVEIETAVHAAVLVDVILKRFQETRTSLLYELRPADCRQSLAPFLADVLECRATPLLRSRIFATELPEQVHAHGGVLVLHYGLSQDQGQADAPDAVFCYRDLVSFLPEQQGFHLHRTSGFHIVYVFDKILIAWKFFPVPIPEPIQERRNGCLEVFKCKELLLLQVLGVNINTPSLHVDQSLPQRYPELLIEVEHGKASLVWCERVLPSVHLELIS
mmetsp:Transcript_48292/g.137179  ORF Transcript_48292/g.137179 Transcript_48292/m.137179 type:complete len:296 (+) Transcript_48292:442-1329(+)